MFTSTQIQGLKAKIASDDLDVLIKDLLKATTFDANLHNQVVMTANRFQEHEHRRIHQLDNTQSIIQDRAQITQQLLHVIDQLPIDNSGIAQTSRLSSDEETTSHHVNKHSKSENPKLYWIGGGIVAAIAVIANLTTILGWMGIQPNEKGKLINVSVYVADKKSDLVASLKKEGYVLMTTEGGGRPKELIDDKSRASFQNIKVGDKVRLNVDFSEPYRPINPDSVYIVPANGQITLTVDLQNLNRVYGTVIYRDQPVAGVLVAIGDLRATTDATGSYNISIPESAQRKEQEVKFLKTGFKMLMKKAYPQTNEPLNIVMEK